MILPWQDSMTDRALVDWCWCGIMGGMEALDIRTEVERAVGSLDRQGVQRAIQEAIVADEPNLRLIRQLTALDLAMEVEQTVLLPLEERSRNLSSPARLAQTYRELRGLLAKDEGEVASDGWSVLLEDPEGEEQSAPLSIAEVSPTGSFGMNRGVTRAEGSEGSSLEQTPSYPPELRQRVVDEVSAGRRSRASIAREYGVSATTVGRWWRRACGSV